MDVEHVPILQNQIKEFKKLSNDLESEAKRVFSWVIRLILIGVTLIILLPYLLVWVDNILTAHPLGNNWVINGNYDTDGNNGDEIGIVNSLYFQILTDAVNSITNYSLGNSYSINGSYDTNGEPGVEIGIVKSGFFELLDDEDNNIRSYGIPGAYFVNGAQNIDGQAGKEILINNYGNNQNATIYDANYQIVFN